MKLQEGIRYVLNDGRETSKLKSLHSGEVFVGFILGLPCESCWHADGAFYGFSKTFGMSISHPVPSRFSRRKSQL